MARRRAGGHAVHQRAVHAGDRQRIDERLRAARGARPCAAARRARAACRAPRATGRSRSGTVMSPSRSPWPRSHSRSRSCAAFSAATPVVAGPTSSAPDASESSRLRAASLLLVLFISRSTSPTGVRSSLDQRAARGRAAAPSRSITRPRRTPPRRGPQVGDHARRRDRHGRRCSERGSQAQRGRLQRRRRCPRPCSRRASCRAPRAGAAGRRRSRRRSSSTPRRRSVRRP